MSFACIKHGSKPRLVKSNAQLDKIIEYISNGNLTDVGILAYYNDQVTQIRDYFQSRGIPVQWKTKDDMEIDFKSTSPKIITWHCAKGLQFNDVFIPCCGLDEYKQYVQWSHEPMTEKKSALYVATTRPLENLYLLYTNNLAPLLPNSNSPVYSGNAGTDSSPF